MQQAQIAEVARQLDEAEKTGQPIRQLSLQYPEITFEQAYAVQEEWVKLKVVRARGRGTSERSGYNDHGP
ncbi:hypothetical protein MQH10_07650, partial [Phenylobacterium aquaticum]|nr:hypothetical protein [Phenylobacterium aquaticum]